MLHNHLHVFRLALFPFPCSVVVSHTLEIICRIRIALNPLQTPAVPLFLPLFCQPMLLSSSWSSSSVANGWPELCAARKTLKVTEMFNSIRHDCAIAAVVESQEKFKLKGLIFIADWWKRIFWHRQPFMSSFNSCRLSVSCTLYASQKYDEKKTHTHIHIHLKWRMWERKRRKSMTSKKTVQKCIMVCFCRVAIPTLRSAPNCSNRDREV